MQTKYLLEKCRLCPYEFKGITVEDRYEDIGKHLSEEHYGIPRSSDLPLFIGLAISIMLFMTFLIILLN